MAYHELPHTALAQGFDNKLLQQVSQSPKQQPESRRRRDTVKHAALPESGSRGWKCRGLPTCRTHRGAEQARTEEPLLDAVQGLSYLWLRGESPLPPAKCFSPERPDSALRNLSPFFQTGDEVDGKYPQQRCVGQTGSELFLLRSDDKLRVQFRPPGLKRAKLQLLFPGVSVRGPRWWRGESSSSAGPRCVQVARGWLRVAVVVRPRHGERAERNEKCGRSVAGVGGSPSVCVMQRAEWGISEWCQQSVTKRTSAVILNPQSYRYNPEVAQFSGSRTGIQWKHTWAAGCGYMLLICVFVCGFPGRDVPSKFSFGSDPKSCTFKTG